MIAESLARYLEDQGEGVLGESIFVSFQPDKPHDVVVVYDEGAPGSDDSSAHPVDQVGIQILVRDRSYESARDKAFSIHRRIANFGAQPFVAGTPVVDVVWPVASPQPVGPDEQGRPEWSGHYTVRIESTGDQWRA